MDSCSPLKAPEPGLDSLQRTREAKKVKLEDMLLLKTQAELMDWTRPQPGESQAKTMARRERIKGKIMKVCDYFEACTAELAYLRTARDNVSSLKRGAFKPSIDVLKAESRDLWDLPKALCRVLKQSQALRQTW